MGAFKKATKTQARLRLAVSGPSGAGKTFTSLRIAKGLGGKVAVIDSERGSASKYADEFSFDVLELQSFHPQRYVEAIKAAEAEGYDVLVIDSLSHAWAGKDGALEQVDRAGDRNKGNKFAGWKDVTPMQNALVDAMLQSRCHVIATMRSKSEWVIEEDSRGKKVPRKIGMAPVQRDQIEYEFDVFGEMDGAKLVITKTRCRPLRDAVINEPGEELAATLKAWLSDGAPAPVVHAGGSDEATIEAAFKARAKRIYEGALANGVAKDEFPSWVERHLGTATPSKAWTVEDMERLEEANRAAAALAKSEQSRGRVTSPTVAESSAGVEG